MRTVRIGDIYEDGRYSRPWTFTVKPSGLSPTVHRYHRRDEAEAMREKVITGVKALGHDVIVVDGSPA